MKFWIVWPQNTLLSRFLAKNGPSGDQKWPLLGWNGCTQKYIILKNTLFKLPKSAPWWGFRVDFDVGIVWSYEFIKKNFTTKKENILTTRTTAKGAEFWWRWFWKPLWSRSGHLGEFGIILGQFVVLNSKFCRPSTADIHFFKVKNICSNKLFIFF